MAIPNQTPYNVFTANGISTVFPYEFYLLSAIDLTVSINGTVQTTGYTVLGVGNIDGGEVVFLTPPANGSVVLLQRMVPTYRLTEYQDNGDLLADTVNKDFDRLWMAIQQAFLYLGLTLNRPLLGGPFNATGYRIENLADPINAQDAATKNYVDATADNRFIRTLRVPESSVAMLPDASIRRNKILAFNSNGNPITVLPESGSAADVLIDLSQYYGFTYLGGVRGVVKTSEIGSLSSAIDFAIANGADVLVDNVQNISVPIRRSLNGADIKITSTANGWINFTPQDENTYYQIITFDGFGVESVTTKVKIDGGKVRGIGQAVVGVAINNVYAHYDGSEIRNVSAAVNTLKAVIHLCYGANYYNVHQQLATQDWNPGVYGYGTVPIDCDLVSVDSCIFGAPGAPLDRHAVYCSSFEDGSGTVKSAFVSKNSVIMRDYTSEMAETTFERAFKFIGTKNVQLINNDLIGGYGFALFTFRRTQRSDSFVVRGNRARTYANGILVSAQSGDDDINGPTWFLADIFSSDNDYKFTCNEPGTNSGIVYRNVVRIFDRDTKYYNEAYAVTKGLTAYFGGIDRIRTTTIDSKDCHFDAFQYLYRGEEPVNLSIDGYTMHTSSDTNPSSASVLADNRNIRIRSIDTSAAWKSGVTTTGLPGFSYYDFTFRRYISSSGPGLWNDDRGFQVVGLSSARPRSMPTGHIFYQTDDNTYVRWTGSKWVLTTVPWSGIPTSGTTLGINLIDKSLLGYGHCVYNIDTKKPAFFDDLAQVWRYADGTSI